MRHLNRASENKKKGRPVGDGGGPKSAASRIVEAVTKRPRGGLVYADVAGAVDLIRQTAQRYRVALAEHDAIMERVTAKVSGITKHVDNVNSNGGLRAFNAIYRAQAANRTEGRRPHDALRPTRRQAAASGTPVVQSPRIGADIIGGPASYACE